MIEIERFSRRYGETLAVNDMSLTVAAGEVFGFVGPNGAGKTTTLRFLATLLPPSGGTARIDGYDVVADAIEVRRRVGFLPEAFGLYETMTAGEFIEFFAGAHGIPPARRDAVVDGVLELVDLVGVKTSPIGSLSGGMRRRLVLARALVHDPSALLLDEPASGLDPQGRAELRELCRELAAMGKAVIVSSHILHELAEICDRVAVIWEGEVIAEGPVADLVTTCRPERTFEVRVLEGVDRAMAALSSLSSCGGPRREGDRIVFGFDGEEADLAAAIARISAAGAPVISFTERTATLDDAYRALTEKRG